MHKEGHRGLYASILLGFHRELRQLLPVPLQEFLVDVAVGVVAHLADLLAAELDHDAGALVHDVLGGALEPRALADLDDHSLVGLVPVAPHVLITPIGGAQAGLAVPQCVQHRLAAAPLAPDARRARHPIHDVVGEVAPDLVALAGEQRLLIGLRDLHAAAHTSTSSGITRGFALRPARSIGFSIMPIIALSRSRIFQKSTARSTSSRDASRSASLAFTCRTLFCMSSASQPREWAMNGNGGNTNPSSDQNVSMPPATAWMLSWPPVMMNAATLFLISTLSWIVIWFCTQFSRSIIL